MYKIFYKSSVQKDFSLIPPKYLKKVINEIENKLSTNPYIGKKLKGIFKDLYSLLVSDYRIVYSFGKEEILIVHVNKKNHNVGKIQPPCGSA